MKTGRQYPSAWAMPPAAHCTSSSATRYAWISGSRQANIGRQFCPSITLDNHCKLKEWFRCSGRLTIDLPVKSSDFNGMVRPSEHMRDVSIHFSR